MHFAAKKGHAEVCRILLANNVDKYARLGIIPILHRQRWWLVELCHRGAGTGGAIALGPLGLKATGAKGHGSLGPRGLRATNCHGG